jgi:hypothetical protein
MDFVVPNEVVYDFDSRASVSEIAKSLVAQDRLLREALAVVQQIYPNLELSQIEITVREVQHASPFKSRIVAFAFGVYSTPLSEDMPDILEALSGGTIDVADNVDSFVNIIVLLLAIYFGEKIRLRFFPTDEEKALGAEKERLLMAAANGAHVPRGTMKDAVEHVANKRPGAIGKAAIDFLTPAKRHHARAIRSGREAIRQEAIEALPSDAEMAMYQPPTHTDELERTLVQFYAHDLTRPKKWAAVIQDASPERLPLHLAPHLKPEPLFARREVLADVVVTSVRSDAGEYVPTLAILTNVYDEDA